jgi:hypothetical protein
VRVVVALLAVAPLIACGPIRSASVFNEADEALQAARTDGAHRSAVYEYTGAEAYLTQARVEAGSADYDQAVRFAEKARDLAREARRKASAARGVSREVP